MKTVVIFRFLAHEGPGYLGDFLNERHIPWQLVKVDEGEPLPSSILGYSGMVLMGGPMSVNDDLPWIASALSLIRQAVATDIPVLGHCLGGQLISKALGGVVQKNPVKEMGWGEVSVAANPAAREWFGELSGFETFHWHGEAFSLPEGATCLLSSPYCKNQAFALNMHFGMQCHVEMTEEMVKAWCQAGAEEIAGSSGPAVQSAELMQIDLSSRVATLNRVADRLYSKWISGLALPRER